MKVTEDGHVECEVCEGSGKDPETGMYCRNCNSTGGRPPRPTDIMSVLCKILKRLDDAGL